MINEMHKPVKLEKSYVRSRIGLVAANGGQYHHAGALFPKRSEVGTLLKCCGTSPVDAH